MRYRPVRLLGSTLLLPMLLAPAGAVAQGVEAQIGRFYEEEGWTSYRLAVAQPTGGPFASGIHAAYLRRDGEGGGALAGLGASVSAFRGGRQGPYLVAALDGGLGSERGTRLSEFWGSWSAGVGYELFPADFLAVAGEARWREISTGHRGGLELAAGLRVHLAPRRSGGRPPAGARPAHPGASPPLVRPPAQLGLPPSAAVPAGTRRAPITLADSVLATAAEAMGRPYQYGGTGADGAGFDCSGLIQYAYGRHGVMLPRRSVDQAREGRSVPKKLSRLAPADLLTFSNKGGRVTHVGLYLGNGRFIHSASRGVQVSELSAEDPYGRWWYQRWVGARRLVE